MPIKNFEVSHLCQVAVLAGGVAFTIGGIYGHAGDGSAPHVFTTPQAASICSFGLANGAFLAFPSRRRSDLVTAAALLCGLIGLASLAFGGSIDVLWLTASLGGAYGAYMTTFIEPLRAAARKAPNAAFSLSPRPTSRRRSDAGRHTTGSNLVPGSNRLLGTLVD